MTTQLTCLALGVAFVAGCAAQSDPAQDPTDHPANPLAAPTPVPPRSETLAEAPAETAGPAVSLNEDETHASATVYTCPHHPEVVSDKPGECPKCHMKLRPKAVRSSPGPATTPADTPHDHGTRQDGHGSSQDGHGGHGRHP